MTGLGQLAIIGGGGFGTALAIVSARAGGKVILRVRDPALAAAINKDHVNKAYLPDITLPPGIIATTDSAGAGAAEAVLMAVPAQFMRETLSNHVAFIRPGAPLLICAKGIEKGTHMLMHEIAQQIVPGHPIAILSGPSFAADIARGLPTAVTLACADRAMGAMLAQSIATQTFRPYLASDIIGVEIGGALKNVIAIACGIAEGRGLGDSARAALMTRGLAEMTRLAVKLGGQAATLMGLAGIGDLSLSCNSHQSRNFSLGLRLGKGESLEDILAGSRGVFEGATTVGAAVQRAQREQIDMPICAAVHAILNMGAAIDAVIAELLARPMTSET